MLSPKRAACCTVDRGGPDAIVHLCGAIDSLNAGELELVLFGLVRDGVERMLLDFDDVESIDASGLRTIVSTANRFRNGPRCVRIVRPSRQVRSVFDAAGLTHFFRFDHAA